VDKDVRAGADDRSVSSIRIAIGLLLALLLGLLYWWLWTSGMLDVLSDEENLRSHFRSMGAWGPAAIVGSMALAIILSPVPSGPIALVSGAVFGPVEGTLYIVCGAELGAIIAFFVARLLGYELARMSTRIEPLLERLQGSHSQNWLMAIVFASRLVPFVSFDAVSYVAGLTPLSFWRFALATLLGVIPISFLFAFFGDEFVSSGPAGMIAIAALIGGMTLLPIGLRLLWSRNRR
jgi:uncharacterized membrane protein YdjX (TVP38/TMEM64 family)